MKVAELIRILSTMDQDATVVIHLQPGYPMMHAIASVTDGNSVLERCDEDDQESHGPKLKNRVFLNDGGHIGYGSRFVFENS